MTPPLLGLAPWLPGSRPRAEPRWFRAEAEKPADRGEAALAILRIEESAGAPPIPPGPGLAGLAAPCSLPAPFLAFLGLPPEREAALAALEGRTAARLAADARAFAASRPRGGRHPLRRPGESRSALDRLRLPLFRAALPLLRARGTFPWGDAPGAGLVEVDVAAFLAGAGIDAAGRNGETPPAVRTRVRILSALSEGAAGIRVDLRDRDPAVASGHALDAVVAAAAAALFSLRPPAPPPPPFEAWWPAPA
jgi:hypothetical protein